MLHDLVMCLLFAEVDQFRRQDDCCQTSCFVSSCQSRSISLRQLQKLGRLAVLENCVLSQYVQPQSEEYRLVEHIQKEEPDQWFCQDHEFLVLP